MFQQFCGSRYCIFERTRCSKKFRAQHLLVNGQLALRAGLVHQVEGAPIQPGAIEFPGIRRVLWGIRLSRHLSSNHFDALRVPRIAR